MNGKIKWYRQEKGYGFLLGEDGTDYFVHYSALPQDQGDVRESDEIEVTFEVKEGKDGRVQATDVVFVKKGEASEDAEESADEEA